MTITLKTQKRNPLIAAEWKQELEKLAADVERWAAEENWSIHHATKKIREPLIGTYSAPVIKVKSAEGEIWLEPDGRDIVGASGRIDIMSWPTHDRAFMVRIDGKWKIILDNGKTLRKSWSKQAVL